jgi:two-component system, cell cycle response regulator CtrA
LQVLIVDNQTDFARSMSFLLTLEGMVVYTTGLGEEGVSLGKIYDYDIILLELQLPDISGYDVLRSLRSAKISTPVLILSGLTDIAYKIKCLGLGADDYLPKPFDNEELVARIHAIVRRSKGHAQSLIVIGDLVVNIEAKKAHIRGTLVQLTVKEYQVLELLALRKGATMTKDMFLDHLYGGTDEPECKVVDVYICKLRRKLLDAGGSLDYIGTIWGQGYVLREPANHPAAIYQGVD